MTATPRLDAAKAWLDAPRTRQTTAEILAEFEREEAAYERAERERKDREHRAIVARCQADAQRVAAMGDARMQRGITATAIASMGGDVGDATLPPTLWELGRGAQPPERLWPLGIVILWIDEHPERRVPAAIRHHIALGEDVPDDRRRYYR